MSGHPAGRHVRPDARRRWLTLVPLALLVATAVAATGLPRAAAASGLLDGVGGAKASADLDVMTFNVRGAELDTKDYDHRRSAIAGAILAELPDLIGTQENVKWAADNLWVDLDRAGHRYDWYGRQRECEENLNSCGDAHETEGIFYNPQRLEDRGHGDFWFCKDGTGGDQRQSCLDAGHGWSAGSPRMATWIHFLDKTTNKEFIAVNTHLDNAAAQARDRGAQKIVAKPSEINPNGLPVILTGDFNSGAGDTPYRTITAAGFADLWSGAAKWGTFYNTYRSDAGQPPTEGSDRIDFILGNAGTTASAAATSTFNLNGTYPSDHIPVLSRVRLP